MWIAALTAALLPIERLVEPDRADGVLDQLALAGTSEEAVGAAKIVGHWLTFGPLLLLAAVPAASCSGSKARRWSRRWSRWRSARRRLAALAVAVAALTPACRAPARSAACC